MASPDNLCAGLHTCGPLGEDSAHMRLPDRRLSCILCNYTSYIQIQAYKSPTMDNDAPIVEDPPLTGSGPHPNYTTAHLHLGASAVRFFLCVDGIPDWCIRLAHDVMKLRFRGPWEVSRSHLPSCLNSGYSYSLPALLAFPSKLRIWSALCLHRRGI